MTVDEGMQIYETMSEGVWSLQIREAKDYSGGKGRCTDWAIALIPSGP